MSVNNSTNVLNCLTEWLVSKLSGSANVVNIPSIFICLSFWTPFINLTVSFTGIPILFNPVLTFTWTFIFLSFSIFNLLNAFAKSKVHNATDKLLM